MRGLQYMVATKGYTIREDALDFDVRIFHFPYARTNEYELYRNGELAADGKCPREYAPDDIFKYHVRYDVSAASAAPGVACAAETKKEAAAQRHGGILVMGNE